MGERLWKILAIAGAFATPLTSAETYDPCGEFSGPARQSCEFSRQYLGSPGPPTEHNGASLAPPPGHTIVSFVYPSGTQAESDGTPGATLVSCADQTRQCMDACTDLTKQTCYEYCVEQNKVCETPPTQGGGVVPQGYSIVFDDEARKGR